MLMCSEYPEPDDLAGEVRGPETRCQCW